MKPAKSAPAIGIATDQSETSNCSGTTSLPRLAYSLKEVAAMLGISYTSVHRLVRRGKLRSTGGLRHKLIAAGDLERFLDERN